MKKTNLIKIIFGIAIVAVFATVGVLYARIWDPLWNPFRPEPKEVMGEMEKKMDATKTFLSNINLKISIENEEKIGIDLKFSGENDKTDPKIPKSKGNFDLSFSYNGMSFSLGGESLVVGENSFLKLTKIPPIPKKFLEESEIDLTSLKNVWIKIDRESLMEWSKTILPEDKGIEFFEKFSQRQKELEEELKKKIEGKIVLEKIFPLKEELPDEKIGEMKVYHFVLTLNKSEVKSLISEIEGVYFDFISEIIYETTSETFFWPSPQEIEEEKKEFIGKLEKEMDKFFQKIGEFPVEIWVGKKDLLLYKLKFEKEIDIGKITEGKEKGRFLLNLNVENSRFGQKIEIREPEEFKEIGEVLEEIFRPVSEKERIRARDTRRMSDMRQIQMAMEIYYDEQHGKYLASKTMPEKIEPFLVEVPRDPGFGPCPDYQWISNLKNPQKFCAFACLENGKFYAVSHKGSKELEEPPKILDCW